MRPTAATRLLFCALPILFAGCDRASDAKSEEAPVAAAAGDAPTTDSDLALSDDDGNKEVAEAGDRMVIRTAHVELRADAPADVIRRAIALTESNGGFVSTSGTRGVGDDVDSAHATLRVPSTSFERVLDALRSEGDVLAETLGGEDVTEEHVDLSARLDSQRVLESRLIDILSKVESVEDALSVETQLTRVRTEIERLDGRKRTLENRVSFATVDLTVSSPIRHNDLQSETVASRLDRALDDAGQAFVAVLGGLIRMLGVLLPLGLVFVPIGMAIRRSWRRRRSQTVAGSMPYAAPIAPPPAQHPPLGPR